jgi:hypothetical protein
LGERDFLVVGEDEQHGSHDERRCVRHRAAVR